MVTKKTGTTAAPPATLARSRRIPIALAVVAAAILAFGAWWSLRSPSFTLTANPNRNVLLVTIDTLRADALGSYGGRATTPNLDRLAAGGARFEFAHAHAVVTLPSHTSILSGRYPYEHGVRDNTGYRVPASLPTAATHLKTHGFATGAFVGGFPLDHRFGLNAGFDVYDDRLAPAAGGSDTANASAAPTPSSRRRSSGSTSSAEVVRVGARLRSARRLRAAAGVGGALPLPIRILAKCPSPMPRWRRCSIGWLRNRAPRSLSSPLTTVRASASTARRRTASSPTNPCCACR